MEVYAHLALGYLQTEVNRLSFFGGAHGASELADAGNCPDWAAVARFGTAQGAVQGLTMTTNAERPEFPSDKSVKSGPNSESRGQDLNLRPSGYEPDELPGCSTPQSGVLGQISECVNRVFKILFRRQNAYCALAAPASIWAIVSTFPNPRQP